MRVGMDDFATLRLQTSIVRSLLDDLERSLDTETRAALSLQLAEELRRLGDDVRDSLRPGPVTVDDTIPASGLLTERAA